MLRVESWTHISWYPLSQPEDSCMMHGPYELQHAAQICFPPTAESFGVSAQIGSGVVWGGPEVRFHKGSTRVPRWFHEVL